MTYVHRPPIEEHPDLVELRDRHDRVAMTPRSQGVEALALLTGLYLAASPWICGFNNLTTLAVTDLLAGITYMLLLGGLGNSYERTHSMAWAGAGIGLWTIVAPWVVAGDVAHTRSITSNIIAGALALVLACVAATGARDKRTHVPTASAARRNPHTPPNEGI
ncbi:SPW repeat protein [Kitasatospora sp. A2-31]|uniref:SPW repeat protein n=1 Tax=Kitasatospora sp. A2-31 TaxID=2916414 RepID=UPI001EEBA358|nr:SPW repeat protein [Kitasatospora sp. A2-31]MCG6494306.1 SPW repeat protein [Kitasatospora sp. A2-31]